MSQSGKKDHLGSYGQVAAADSASKDKADR
jgi:hypothetical protein